MIGTVLQDTYRIERLLGAGGMGTVYAATHLRLEKHVAVKVMARELAEVPEALARFRREAVVTGGLGHPHIVQVFDFSTTPEGQPFLVMELLAGEDLDRRLRRVGRLGLAEVAGIIEQVASALAAAHAQGIVHRDLKPANIYLTKAEGEGDFVKVLDFGISKILASATKITKTASVMGSPTYMSPEQAEGKIDAIDERTDQWALACIAWECLAGRAPFVADNVPSVLYQVVHSPPPSLAPGYAYPQVEALLLRALAKRKDDRFGSVKEFAAALAAATRGSPPVRSPSVVATALLPETAPPAAPTTLTGAAGTLTARPPAGRRSRTRWPNSAKPSDCFRAPGCTTTSARRTA